MANTLTAVTADVFRAAEIVGAEGVGMLNSVMINGGSEAAAQGETVKSVSTEEPTLNTSATPAMTIPEGDDQTFTEPSFTLDKIANVAMNITGEEEAKLDTSHNFDTIHGNRFVRAFRAIRNTIEARIATVAKEGASRAFGTAGTTPFGSNFDEIAEIRQILFDNGFLMSGEMSLVVNSLAGTNLRNLASLQKVNEAGSSDLLRMGELLNLQSFSLKESDGIGLHTIGTGASYLTSAAEAVGSTTIDADTGTGTVLAGDIVTFAADTTNKFVVNTALSGGTFTIGEPGIREAIADNNAITVGAAYTANIAVARPAMELAARPQKVPSGGDAAVDAISVSDPFSGLVYEVREYRGYKKSLWDITLVYEAKVWESAGVAILLG